MDVNYSDSFDTDFKLIKDNKLKGLILSRIDRIQEYGETGFGDFKPITGSKNLYELRFHYGPGYRIYFTKIGGVIIILLCGGDKGNQSRDIDRAEKIREQANEKYKK